MAKTRPIWRLARRCSSDDALAGGAYDWAVRHRDVIVRFGRYPHRNAPLGRQSTAEEIAFLQNYLEIEQARFGGRLSYRVLIPDQVLEARVPNLILHPLVENALRHGLATRAGPGRVDIKAHRQGDSLLLSVVDDGRGLPPATTERVGLANTRARLRLLYADRQRFDVRNSDDGGVIAEIELPWRTAP